MKPTRNFFLTLTKPEVAITSDDLFPRFFWIHILIHRAVTKQGTT